MEQRTKEKIQWLYMGSITGIVGGLSLLTYDITIGTGRLVGIALTTTIISAIITVTTNRLINMKEGEPFLHIEMEEENTQQKHHKKWNKNKYKTKQQIYNEIVKLNSIENQLYHELNRRNKFCTA